VFFTGTQAFSVQVSEPTGDTVVSGGWTRAGATPCDTQSIDARLSELDAEGRSQVLSIRRNRVSGKATPLIRVSNLTPVECSCSRSRSRCFCACALEGAGRRPSTHCRQSSSRGRQRSSSAVTASMSSLVRALR
jgi:hypothetical protein